MEKPYSAACERNQAALLQVLENSLPSHASVLEIGSGTGQHALYFTEHLDDITWQPSDLEDMQPGLISQLQGIERKNLEAPIVFDVNVNTLNKSYDAIFTANTCHIMGWSSVESMLKNAANMLNPKGLLFIYGPFKIGSEYTSASNQSFDQELQQENASQGLRDAHKIGAILEQQGLQAVKVIGMPANNLTLVFQAP